MPKQNQIIYGFLLSSIILNAAAAEFKSESAQATLLELYTSEGCSSCPPAEKYLNSLKSDKKLWKDIIPLAFHVDYWDYLGWRDGFAKPEHRIRQENYAALNQQNTIYTPAFFLNGKPWRRGLFDREPSGNHVAAGVLSVKFANSQISASFAPLKTASNSWILNVAILGFGLESDIRAGENQGRVSQHEFVVLHQQSRVSHDKTWSFALNTIDMLAAEQYALVAWVTAANDPRPVQAVGGYLDDFK